MDSTFFKWELLTDKRFRDASHYVGGMEKSDLRENRKLESELKKSYRRDAEPLDSVTFNSVPAVDLLAVGMTWWTIFIEGLIALFCLWPGDRIIAVLRALVVLVFAATTYLLAPVLGFGWMVILMGLTQCPEQHRKLRASLLLVLGLMYLYRLKLGPMLLKTAEVGFAEMARFY
jgi:type III secretory pathway component EscS